MKIGFIGVGNMGGSILRGYLSNKQISPKDIYICDSDEEKVHQLERILGINGCSTIEDLTIKCNTIIVGVKPNGFEQVLPKISSMYAENKIIVSMAAGINISYIEKFFDHAVKVVRIMPNTAAIVNGMAKEQAIVFAAQAVLGAAKMVLETGIDPVQLRINVCSPGGTTIEAVNTLKKNGFENNIKEGFQAAVDKSKLMVKQ